MVCTAARCLGAPARVAAVACAALSLVAVRADAQQASLADSLRPHAAAWERLVRIEDARFPGAATDTLRMLMQSPSPPIRELAVRGAGRTERPDLLPLIRALLDDADPRVRAAAAAALAQTFHGSAASAPPQLLTQSRGHLLRLTRDPHPVVAGAAAESLGRLTYDSAGAHAAIQAIVPLLREDNARLGALRGLYWLTRQSAARPAFGNEAAGAVNDVLRTPAPPRERVVALMVLGTARRLDPATLEAAFRDASETVRREALLAAAATDTALVGAVLPDALRDTSALVRVEAVRVHARLRGRAGDCDPLVAATHDPSVAVAVTAVDQVAQWCLADPAARARLHTLAGEPGAEPWQPAGHALVALANIDPPAALRIARQHRADGSPFIRMRVAAAAAAARDTALLREMAADVHPNVRAIAIDALHRLAPHGYDDVAVAALGSADAQLLMAAAAALDGSSHPGAAAALVSSLERVSAARRETSRDARVALVHALRTAQGAVAFADRLRPLLHDMDPVVADSAAAVLSRLTGTVHRAEPRPAPTSYVLAFEDAARLAAARADITLEDGRVVRLRMLPFVAPTNVKRFATLAEAGYYDGLTFHRVVPNFVVQGGSPGANEYSGDGPFTRDEVGAGNWRGTVGLSTRGRDTGDAQFYVNLVDNVRLDHEYTVFAEVESGMDIIDALGEGARIRSIRIIHPN